MVDLDDLVNRLLEENILPLISDSHMVFKDTFHNRNIAYNELYRLGFTLGDKVIKISKGKIYISLDKLCKDTDCQKAAPVTCYLFNNDFEVLSRSESGLYFDSSPDSAVPFFKAMALALMKKKEYEQCHLVELNFVHEEKEKIKVISSLINFKHYYQ